MNTYVVTYETQRKCGKFRVECDNIDTAIGQVYLALNKDKKFFGSDICCTRMVRITNIYREK